MIKRVDFGQPFLYYTGIETEGRMYILIVEYCFYTLWIYLGLHYGLPFFGKYFLDSGTDKYGERHE